MHYVELVQSAESSVACAPEDLRRDVDDGSMPFSRLDVHNWTMNRIGGQHSLPC